VSGAKQDDQRGGRPHDNRAADSVQTAR